VDSGFFGLILFDASLQIAWPAFAVGVNMNSLRLRSKLEISNALSVILMTQGTPSSASI
jgi:hypothetical protein